MKYLLLIIVLAFGMIPTIPAHAAAEVCDSSCTSFLLEECEDWCTTTVKITPLTQGVTITVSAGWSVKLVGSTWEVSSKWRNERSKSLSVKFSTGGTYSATFSPPKDCRGVVLPIIKKDSECENPAIILTWNGYSRIYPFTAGQIGEYAISLPELPGNVPITIASSGMAQFRQYQPYYHNYGFTMSVTINPQSYLGKPLDIWIATQCGSVWVRTFIDPIRGDTK